MSEDVEKKKPGPAPRFGERKACLTRMTPALVERLQARIELANEKRRDTGEPELSLSEGIAQLIEWALNKIDATERKEKGAPQKPRVQPAPVAVSVLVGPVSEEPAAPIEVAPPVTAPPRTRPPDKAPALWAAVWAKLRPMMGEGDLVGVLGEVSAVSLDELRLTLSAPSPYWVRELEDRIGGLVSSLATELVGSLVEIVWVVSPAYAERLAAAEESAAAKAAQREQEDHAREGRCAKLVELYGVRDVAAAEEAGAMLVAEPELIHLLSATSRKLIVEWIASTRAGADYQQGKETEYRGPRRRGAR